MRKPIVSLVAVTTLVLTLAGCMVGETTHTLYLSPGGEVTWTVLESVFRSDAASDPQRRSEELDWLSGQSVAEAMRALRPLDVEVSVLRAARPYSVRTQARFAAVDGLARELLRELEVPGRVSLERQGSLSRLSVALEDCAVDSAELERVHIVLTEGTFLRAEGFRLSQDRTAAVPQPSAGPCWFLLEWGS